MRRIKPGVKLTKRQNHLTKLRWLLFFILAVMCVLFYWNSKPINLVKDAPHNLGSTHQAPGGGGSNSGDALETKNKVKPVLRESNILPLHSVGEPQLEILVERLRQSLKPFMMKHLTRVKGVKSLTPNNENAGCGGGWISPIPNVVFKGVDLEGASFSSLDDAQKACLNEETCKGVTLMDGKYFLTSNNVISFSKTGAKSYERYLDPCLAVKRKQKFATAQEVWKAFHDALDVSLSNQSLNLMSPLQPTRNDDSIYISIAAYRDVTCKSTLKRAFERAKYPEKLFVGIVQQNCMHESECMTGTGWAETRQWVSRLGPDPDCAEAFCASSFGKKFCDNKQVRILRLDEIDAYGPFFTRFLNWKMWRGENFFMQIDAHTDFKSNWDESLVAQMKATPTFPKSVISNYPLGGSPTDQNNWIAGDPLYASRTPEALCSCTFETAGSGNRYTVRLAQTTRTLAANLKSAPRKSAFVAAGFLITHGTFCETIGFDPFLPYLFMGEELALSVRFFTHGFDIYAPSVDVLKHEYVRMESSKFWESVSWVYSNGALHNDLTDLIVERVQYLSGFPEARELDQIQPKSIVTRMQQFGLGDKRTKEQFAQVMGLDYGKRHCTPQHWCTHGEDWVLS